MKFTCPRCHREVEERFYGPCGRCREVLIEAAIRPPAPPEANECPRCHDPKCKAPR